VSVELEVKLRSKEVSVHELVSIVSAELRARFPLDAHPSWPSWMEPETLQGVLGGAKRFLNLGFANDTSMQLLVLSIGDEEVYGEDGGWWVSISPIIRTPQSYCLMMLTAACLARLTQVDVLDDARFLDSSRWISPEVLLTMVGGSKNLCFAEDTVENVRAGRLKKSPNG
jgi:hypothetical protein